jgi:hypothetical protein
VDRHHQTQDGDTVTTIHVIDGDQRRPALTVAETFDVTIPAETSHKQLLTHARRVTSLTAELSTVTYRLNHSDAEGFQRLAPVGIAMSQALDLGLGTEPDTRWISQAAFPAHPGAWFRAAIRFDVPRYHPGRGQWRCPFPGPRGGKCRNPRRTGAKVVTDPVTGDWAWHDVCSEHRPLADAGLRAAPAPPPNRGGILARVFPEWDLDGLYQWANDRYDPAGIPVGADTSRPPKLRVLDGGA